MQTWLSVEAVTALFKLCYYEIFISSASIRANFKLQPVGKDAKNSLFQKSDTLCTHSVFAVIV